MGGHPTVVAGRHHRWPQIDERDRAAVLRVLESGVFSGPDAPEIVALQAEWGRYVGAEYCIAVNSGTAALHCCAAAAGLAPGDEVIVPALTFVATAMAIVHQGATPVFCDIAPETYTLDAALVTERISERTKAIVPVHLHGLPADMNELCAVAERHGLAVIEDAAQAHGARYRGEMVGTLGHTAAFSLQATKGLSGGDGGLFVTNDPHAWMVARRLTMFGEDADLAPGGFRAYWSHGVGWNYRAHELSAALARSQLARIDEFVSTAQANAQVLSDGLSGVVGVKVPQVPDDRTSVFHKYRVVLDVGALGLEVKPAHVRDRLIKALRAEGVQAVTWQLHPLPALPAFRQPPTTWYPRQGRVELSPWDPDEYPVATRILDGSMVIGSETAPLYVQDEALMKDYVRAIRRVMGRVDEILALPDEAVPAV